MYRKLLYLSLKTFDIRTRINIPIYRKFSTSVANRKMLNPRDVVVQVIGSGNSGSPKSVYLFTQTTRYLFNCGEGTQRLAHEHKTRLSRLENIFLTSLEWDSVGGLPGLSLTLQDIGITNLTLHAPPGLDELFTATNKFVVLNNLSFNIAKCEENNVFKDSVISVKYVPIHRANNSSPISTNIQNLNINDQKIDKVECDDTDYYGHETTNKRHLKEKELEKLMSLPKRQSFSTLSYICRLKDRLGMLDLQKCVSKGVKPGPMLGLLKNGQDVTLPDGTVIYAHDVKTPDEPGPVFIVIDIPDEEYLDNLLKCKDFEPHQEKTATDSIDLPKVIIHFTPMNIIKNEKYQLFINTFPSTTDHLLVNGSENCCSSISVQRIQYKLNLLNKDVFPLINYFDDKLDKNNELGEENSNFIVGKTLTSYYLRAENALDRSTEVKCIPSEYIAEVYENTEFSKSLQTLHNSINSIKRTPQKYPMITFFGTGSCIPNKTRNTSGILLHFDENNCMILDCGEGTYGQMVKFFGDDKIDAILCNLKVVYISHLHADHHIGLVNLLLNRKRALLKMFGINGLQNEHKLYLLAPKQIMTWLNIYHNRFREITDDFELIGNAGLVEEYINKNPFLKDPKIDELLEKNKKIQKINTCLVRHCPNAFGISITTDDNKKITYSGDTMPCDRLVEMGMDSDILIHEATMEDELDYEAVKKTHSTTSQAVEIGKQMNAKFTILTHFSQRYARVPRLSSKIEEEFNGNNVGIAFDNMQVSFDNLQILPLFYPSLKLMFADHCEELEVKAAKRAIKRSSNLVNEKNLLKRKNA